MSVIVRDVSKRMGKNDVLRNVSIEVDPGTVVGLQGTEIFTYSLPLILSMLVSVA